MKSKILKIKLHQIMRTGHKIIIITGRGTKSEIKRLKFFFIDDEVASKNMKCSFNLGKT